MNNEKFTFFWSNNSPFSNWYKADFRVKEIAYNCSEQYMMHQKALLFGDQETADKILATNNPGKQKALGRQVKNFDQNVWEDNCGQIVFEGNYHKFTQNASILRHLLDTEGTTLVEASPVDNIWGIGLAEDHPKARSRKTWRGKNLLGELLTKLRTQLIEDEITD